MTPSATAWSSTSPAGHTSDRSGNPSAPNDSQLVMIVGQSVGLRLGQADRGAARDPSPPLLNRRERSWFAQEGSIIPARNLGGGAGFTSMRGAPELFLTILRCCFRSRTSEPSPPPPPLHSNPNARNRPPPGLRALSLAKRETAREVEHGSVRVSRRRHLIWPCFRGSRR